MLISIIIPVYNVEKYLNECVDSVLTQTINNIEIILVDDGSTDNSPFICDELANNYTNIKVIHKENGGLSSARNEGIKNALGDYVMFIDSDDFWDNNKALENISRLLNNEPDLVCFGYREYIEGQGYNGKGISFDNFDTKIRDKNIILEEMLSKGIYISSACCKAIKTDVIKDNDLYFKEGITSEDIDWSARLLKCVKSIAVYPESFYNYRQRNDSIVHSIKYDNLKTLSDNIICCVKFGDDIKNNDFKKLYYNYVAYQYITFLKVALLCVDDNRTKSLVKEMKEYKWLLNYHLNKKVKIVYLANRFLGYSIMNKLLKIYS